MEGFGGGNPASKNQASRIRATRGRSTERQRDRETERQRDRESRPNPLKDPRDSHKALRPADAGRGARRFHSIAKQAPFEIAFRGDFGRLGKPKCRFWETNIEAKAKFSEQLYDVLF